MVSSDTAWYRGVEGVPMRVSEYVDCDAVRLAELVATGQVAPDEPEAAARAAVAEVNPRINAVVETWSVDEAHAGRDAPLAGVPFLIKDIGIAMAGQRMELGSRLAAGNVARADSFLMHRFRRAGLVTLGRTATPEMAYDITTEPVLYGATRNPWDPRRSAGGSSGGSAAAVAAGIVPVAHGTDAAGSLRIPAAYNGLFAMKTTRGRISVGPDADEMFNGLAVPGCVSRTVRDSALLLDRMRGQEPGDPYVAPEPSRPYATEVGRDPGRLRIGVLTAARGGRRTSAPVADALSRTVGLVESLGHRVAEAEVGLGVGWEEFVLATARLFTANLAALVDQLAAALGRPIDDSTLEPVTLSGYRYGRRVSGPELVAALAVRNRVARGLAGCFEHYDVLLTPTMPELPPLLGAQAEAAATLDGHGWLAHVVDRAPFTVPFNMAGTPAMSVPVTADAATGLPIGMQFAAALGREGLLFRLAGQLERASPWSGRTAAVRAGYEAGG